MPLPLNHPVNEAVVHAYSPSVGASAVTAYARAPFRGKVIKVGSVLYGAITTGDATVATAINGTAITGGAIAITQSGSAGGQVNTAIPTAANDVNEDDVISFPPAGAGGANIAATFFAVIKRS
jgi:hypothetical protein